MDDRGVYMTRLIRDFIEVEDKLPLDGLIEQLVAARALLPQGAVEAEVRMTGDDIFGRRLSISFLRPQTPEEIAREGRYADAHRASRLRQLAELRAELAGEGEDLSIAA